MSVRKLLVTLLLALAVCTLSAPTAANAGVAAKYSCANKLCTKYNAKKTKSCRSLGPHGRLTAHQMRTRCFVIRGARHYGVSIRLAKARAWRESRYHARVVNRYGYAGVLQMSYKLFMYTPYGKKFGDRRRNARLAALAYGWLNARGEGCHWNPPNYCA